ncbi:MAG: winged helix-turn-helix domain-containing protein [Acetobacteraceae bacterium]
MSEHSISFGPFRLVPARQQLLDGGQPVRLGSRALEILIALTERPGEVVSKDELTARAWPDTFVEEGNLRVHIAGLRRALGDGHDGKRYLATVPGRGYRFIAPVTVAATPLVAPPPAPARTPAPSLPSSVTRTIGRGDIVASLAAQLAQRRFITIVGPGGIGKTTVALAVADRVRAAQPGRVCFIDLSPIADPQLVPSALAAALSGEIHASDPIPGLLALLREERMLLVLDSCEHVVEMAAVLAERLLRGVPGLHVLATSREPLRAEGERVHHLAPLDSPAPAPGMTAAEAIAYPAVQLFVERAAASVDTFELTDAIAPIVADICRRLDGIPLAIELAAARVDAFGVRELAARLNDRIRLLTRGRRTALPRHQTLAATLDWSYHFLPEPEQVMLRRLAIFVGPFTAQSADAIAGTASDEAPDFTELIANLVAKSLVAADVGSVIVHYRLLDTTRAYALDRLGDSNELPAIARRHAEYYRDRFDRAAARSEAVPRAEWLAAYGRDVDEVRAALEWCFSPEGDRAIGVSLTIASVPLWMQLSLLGECHASVEKALAAVDASSNGRDEMLLRAAFGMSLLYTLGPVSETGLTWERVLRLAESLDDREYQLRALYGLWLYRTLVRDFRGALEPARQFERIAGTSADRTDAAMADRMIGMALHYLGDQAQARVHIDRSLDMPLRTNRRLHTVRYGVDQRVGSLTQLSRILWLQGLPEQAMRAAHTAIEDARMLDHGNSLCLALADGAGLIAAWTSDVAEARHLVTMLSDTAEKHALGVWRTYGRALGGWLEAQAGNPAEGVAALRAALADLRQTQFDIRYPLYLAWLAEALGAAGEPVAGLAAIEGVLDRAERAEERWHLPELLRLKGSLLLQAAAPNAATAAAEQFERSLELARRQGALAWELRAATSLARLRGDRPARDLLAAVVGRFTEGLATGDMVAAAALLATLDAAPDAMP